MLDKVKQYIRDNSLIADDKLLLVAVSGGRDSVALLSILNNLHYELNVLHCNFRLRSGESDRDEYFVRQLCERFNIPLIVRHFDTIAYSKCNGISVEMAARELRYEWFERMRQKLRAQGIAVAHHEDDQAETMLLNLNRGTGLRGLCGMRAKNGYVVRPLLCINRCEIENYLTEQGLTYVDDSTNDETIYKRNKIRHDILPTLKVVNSNITETLCREADNFQRTTDLYDYFIQQERERICKVENGDIEIDIKLLQQHPLPKQLLYELIRDYGFNWEQCCMIFDNLDAQSGKRFLSADYVLIKDRDTLLLYRPTSTTTEPMINVVQRERQDVEHFPPTQASHALFDAKILDQPLTLRHWQHGDMFYPLGMNESKKLSDYFTNRKISLKRKHELWLLMSGDDIAWIVGERIDNRYKVKKKTKHIAEIKIE